MTSSAALKGGDSSRDAWSRCRFAVHRPGIPEASPRSHGMPCRGSTPGGAGARLALADSLKVSHRTDIPEEVKRRFLPSLKARGLHAAILMICSGRGHDQPIHTVLMLQNSRMPWTDSSRP